MFRTIMVPLDGTSFSEQALPTAMAIAHRTHAAMRLVRVHLPQTTDELWAASELWSGAPTEKERWENEYSALQKMAEEIAATGIEVKFSLVQGAVVDALLAHADAVGADLVVMTTHGRGPLTRAVLGSVSDPLARRLKAATLLVRPHETVPKHGHPLPTRRLLVALDGSKESEAMLATAVELGEAVGAEFTLLRVIDFAAYYGADPAEVAACYPEVAPMQELQTKAAAYLEELAEPLRRRGLHVQTRAVIHSDPAAMILQQAHDLHCDLIALESRGEAGLARLMLGSVEDAVVRYGKTAVLTHAASAGKTTPKH